VKIRTVNLEITRHGPPHNQLISPLTQYLAQSARYEAVTVQMPWEHWRFLRELRVLRYGSGRGRGADPSFTSSGDVSDIAAQVSAIFRAVPGLIAGLSTPNEPNTLTHLRLIFSPSELALVPFELSKSPSGFPAEGDFLSTQAVAPLVMTREIRGAIGQGLPWPHTPKILFAWAEPAGVSPVPWSAHLQALVRALRPWTGRQLKGVAATGSQTAVQRLAPWLTMLPQASLTDIARACASECYTHVHLLAHGGAAGDPEHPHYAVLLRGAVGAPDPDYVSGDRLAAAMLGQLTTPTQSNSAFSCPAVVTLANCDSGNQGSVILPGSSVAHALHSAGVPLVVGSLFPLSKRGSVRLTQELYEGLLGGDDPRCVLHRARLALRAEDTRTHDWASMIAYASFHERLTEQVVRCRHQASERTIHIVNKQIEELIGPSAPPAWQDLLRDLDRAGARLPTTDGYEVEGNGRLGSKNKRKSQALFQLARLTPEREVDYLRESYAALAEAVENYRRGCVKFERSFNWDTAAPHWVLTQAVGTEAGLGLKLSAPLWRRALLSAELDLDGDPLTVAWAHGSLVELYLLRILLDEEPASTNASDRPLKSVPLDQVTTLAEQSAQHVANGARLHPYLVESTERQIKRYVDWWNSQLWRGHLSRISRLTDEMRWKQVATLADKILVRLKHPSKAVPL